MYHQKFSANCWRGPETLSSCLENGLGQRGIFDCSGFVICSLVAMLGRSVVDWPADLRHSRQMWHNAEQQNGSFTYDPAQDIGSLIVMRRRWTVAGQDCWVPAHIGILTDRTVDDLPVVLMAQARDGAVVERPLETAENVLGALRYVSLDMAAGRMALASTLED